MAPAYKLTYFGVRGVAEPCRFLMKYGGIEFEDDRFTFEQWPELKANMPFGQVPILTVNATGKRYNQSLSIARFFAKKVKLTGDDAFEDMEIDGIVDTINDLRMKLAAYFYATKPADKETVKASLVNETVPYVLKRLDKIAEENGGHLACKKLTWADLYFAALVDTLAFLIGMPRMIDDYPNLEAVKNKVYDIPEIKAWVQERPKTDL